MRNKIPNLILLAIAFCFTHSAHAELVVFGLDDDKNVISKKMNSDEYLNILNSSMSSVNDSMLNHLQTLDTTPESLRRHWSLRTIGVGIGLTGQIGLGPIFSVAIRPKIRLIYTNSTKPTYPE